MWEGSLASKGDVSQGVHFPNSNPTAGWRPPEMSDHSSPHHHTCLAAIAGRGSWWSMSVQGRETLSTTSRVPGRKKEILEGGEGLSWIIGIFQITFIFSFPFFSYCKLMHGWCRELWTHNSLKLPPLTFYICPSSHLYVKRKWPHIITLSYMYFSRYFPLLPSCCWKFCWFLLIVMSWLFKRGLQNRMLAPGAYARQSIREQQENFRISVYIFTSSF